MKYRKLLVCLMPLIGLLCLGLAATAQVRPPRNPGAGLGAGQRNVISVTFSRAWDYPLTDPVKLIDIGPVTNANKNSLVTLLDSKDPNDYSRSLVVTHWDGIRFTQDASMNFKGFPVDALLIGRFRSAKTAPVVKSPFDKPIAPSGGPGGPQPKPVNKPDLPPYQIVTCEGIYAWLKGGLARLFGAPLDPRLTMVLDQNDDKLVTGVGDNSASYEIGENYVRESSDGAPKSGSGYIRIGVGLQEYPGKDKVMLASDIRYVQSIWEGRYKWMVGLAKGVASQTVDGKDTTTGDRLVVYTPKFSSRKDSFWASKMDDFEEDWRSDPLPGRVLDVRIGDPKNDGKVGILVLTSENKDKERHLYFYQPDR